MTFHTDRIEPARGRRQRNTRNQKAEDAEALSCCLLLAACCLLFVVACQQQMADQPRVKPLAKGTFFEDGRSARPLVPGTVPRGQLDADRVTSTFPFPITSEVLARGQERFNIFCAPCHDRVGTGQGMVVQRGFRSPPSYHTDRLRRAPVGHFFDVITNGFGAMPDYAIQVPPRDRWAIVAYIRALQLSQNSTLADVPPTERQQLLQAGP